MRNSSSAFSRRDLLKVALSSCISPLTQAAGGGPVVRTTAGRVRGFIDEDLQVFRGIRYGTDTGPRRFQPPLPAQPWRGIVETREFGPASPQGGSEIGRAHV